MLTLSINYGYEFACIVVIVGILLIAVIDVFLKRETQCSERQCVPGEWFF